MAIGVKKLLKDLLSKDSLEELARTHDIQCWASLALKKQGRFVVDGNNTDTLLLNSHGLLFHFDDQYITIVQVYNDYEFGDIRENDIVVDIGADIGAFSLAAAGKAKQVYAIEPVFGNKLRDNIKLNNFSNIEVLEYGIGNNGAYEECSFAGYRRLAPMITFEKLQAGLPDRQVDFLKVDCEGYEWTIKPEDFEDIRRIEAELHFRKKHKKEDSAMFSRWLEWFKENGYTYKLEWNNTHHPYFTDMGLVHVRKS